MELQDIKASSEFIDRSHPVIIKWPNYHEMLNHASSELKLLTDLLGFMTDEGARALSKM